MGLLDKLQLQPPKAWATGQDAGVAALLDPGAAASSGKAGPGGTTRAAAKADPAGAGGDDAPVVATKVLGNLRWEGHKGVLYGLADGEGDEVEQGRGSEWKGMAIANVGSRGIIAATVNLGIAEKKWRDGAAVVKQGATNGSALLKKVAGAIGDVSKRKAADPAFRGALQQYYKKFDELKALALEIEVQDSEFNARLNHLGSILKAGEIEKAADYVKMTEDEIKQVHDDIETAKSVLSKVMTLGMDIRAFAVAPSAAGALGLIAQGVSALGGAIIEGQYAEKLGALEAQLEGAKTQLVKLKSEKYANDVEEARSRLRGASAQCKIASVKFASAVQEIGWLRATAMDEAKKAPSTKVVSEVFDGIKKQRDAIRALKGDCEAYLKLLDAVTAGVNKLRDHYAYISDWIEAAAREDSRLTPESKWGRAAELAGRKNAVELGDWLNHMPLVRKDCVLALQTTDGKSAAAAIAPYEEAVRRVNSALAVSA